MAMPCTWPRASATLSKAKGYGGIAIGPYTIIYTYLYLNGQNVLGTHHASAHGGSSVLIVKMLD